MRARMATPRRRWAPDRRGKAACPFLEFCCTRDEGLRRSYTYAVTSKKGMRLREQCCIRFCNRLPRVHITAVADPEIPEIRST